MRKIFIFLFLNISFFLFIFSSKIFAEIRINEIYPAPPKGEYEWIELYNDEDKIINLLEYQLLDLANNKLKFSTTSALPFTFILATSSSILNNNGDTVYLKNQEKIIEIATYSGSFDWEKTFARCPDFSGQWFILNQPTKNNLNETACLILTPTPTPTQMITETPILDCPEEICLSPTNIPTQNPTPTQTPIPTPISYQNIYLSEVYPNPQTGENEWVEIYNANDFTVNLTNWYLDDLENAGSLPKKFSLTIQPKSYAVFNLSTSIFNNDADAVRLLDFEKKEKDSFEYQNSQKGKSFGRISLQDDQFCLQEPSPNQPNSSCLLSLLTPTPFFSQNSITTPTKTPTTKIFLSTTKKNPPKSPKNQVNFPKNNSDNSVNQQHEEVLGVSSKINKDNPLFLLKLLTFNSFIYSLLTIFSILFKINLTYEKIKRLLLPSVYSQREK